VYECEVCGKQVERIFLVNIEGAQMNVCEKCAKGKSAVEVMAPRQRPSQQHQRQQVEGEGIEVVAGYGNRIRNGRDAMGISLKVLAERISEKESTLFRVENEKMLPNDKLIRKLEHELGIKLTEVTAKEIKKAASRKDEPVTLGDFMIKKKE
jgi:putative transcription factor